MMKAIAHPSVTEKFEFSSVEQMHDILLRERARADRNHHEFSVIALELGKLKRNSDVLMRLHKFLNTRLRRIDEIGWFTREQLGIVLPYTDSVSAAHLANEMRRQFQDVIAGEQVQIYAYPSVWPFKK